MAPGTMQDEGGLSVFVYVWREEYRAWLEEVPWDLDFFLAHDLDAYWQGELENEYV
jgi:hypothetical protein